MLTLGLGQLFYVMLCFINAIAVLSEERFLARSKRDEIVKDDENTFY